MRKIASRVNQNDIRWRSLYQCGGVGGQHANGVQQQAEGRQNLRGRLQDAGHQQQLAQLMPPPVLRRMNAIIISV